MKWRDHADEFADTLKIATIFSKYTLDRYGGHYYGKAQNLRRRLRAAYDAALAVTRPAAAADHGDEGDADPGPGRDARRRSRGEAGRAPATPARSTPPAIRRSAFRAAWRTAGRSA